MSIFKPPSSFPIRFRPLRQFLNLTHLVDPLTYSPTVPYKNGSILSQGVNVSRLDSYSKSSLCKTLPNDVFILGYLNCGNKFLSKILVELIIIHIFVIMFNP